MAPGASGKAVEQVEVAAGVTVPPVGVTAKPVKPLAVPDPVLVNVNTKGCSSPAPMGLGKGVVAEPTTSTLRIRLCCYGHNISAACIIEHVAVTETVADDVDVKFPEYVHDAPAASVLMVSHPVPSEYKRTTYICM